MSIRVLEYKLKTTYALVKQRKLKNFASRNSQESNKDNTVIPNIIWKKRMRQNHVEKIELVFTLSKSISTSATGVENLSRNK